VIVEYIVTVVPEWPVYFEYAAQSPPAAAEPLPDAEAEEEPLAAPPVEELLLLLQAVTLRARVARIANAARRSVLIIDMPP